MVDSFYLFEMLYMSTLKGWWAFLTIQYLDSVMHTFVCVIFLCTDFTILLALSGLKEKITVIITNRLNSNLPFIATYVPDDINSCNIFSKQTLLPQIFIAYMHELPTQQMIWLIQEWHVATYFLRPTLGFSNFLLAHNLNIILTMVQLKSNVDF